jgi:subtilase family serine protease
MVSVCQLFPVPTRAAERQKLHGHVPPAAANSPAIGRWEEPRQLHLALALPLRNQDALDQLLKDLYDPASPKYHQYLTPAQFTEQFGPTAGDYQKLINFARANHLAVTATHPNRTLLDVKASVADVERAFQVTMRTYRHPTEARTFFAPDVEPSLDLDLPVLCISGLNNFVIPHPMDLKRSSAQKLSISQAQTGSGPNGFFIGNDFRSAYVPGVALNGAGQSVGLLEFDGYYSSDITAYESLAHLPNVTVTNVLMDEYDGTPGSAVDEVSLDIEMAISMAPGLASVIVYEAGPNGIGDDVLNWMANDTTAKQLSSSWTFGTDSATPPIFQQYAAQGQSYFNASGDSGAYTGAIPAPADFTNIVSVGGTTLTTTGNGGSWVSETVWNWFTGGQGNGAGSGGISTTYTIPSWQQGVNMSANMGSTSRRNIPDVAMTADEIYILFGNGQSEEVGGTSCATPLWAAFTALVNQQGAINAEPPVGFLDPALYAIGKGPNYAACFHDITTGNNTNTSTTSEFFAEPGYDLCTGWGTPTGSNLVNALAPFNAFRIAPVAGFTSGGLAGGPFSVASASFTLTNASGTTLSWKLSNAAAWLNLSPTNGTLAAGGAEQIVTASLNSSAATLATGTYTATIWFTNLATGAAQSRTFTLVVGSLVQNGGFEAGNFSSWTLLADLGADAVVQTGGRHNSNSEFVHSGSFGAKLRQPSELGQLFQEVPTLPGHAYLLSLWLVNPFSGDTPNEFAVVWNGNTLWDRVNLGQFNTFSNLQFVVVAASASTDLRLKFRNDPQFFGVDDISLTPIATPAFQSVKRTNSTLTVTWSATSGIMYQLQYTTSLSSANWINLGSVVTATGSTVNATDTIISGARQRFYRVQLVP